MCKAGRQCIGPPTVSCISLMDSSEKADSCHLVEPLWGLPACFHKHSGCGGRGCGGSGGSQAKWQELVSSGLSMREMRETARSPPHCLPTSCTAPPAGQPASTTFLLRLARHHKTTLLLRHHHHANHLPLLGPTGGGQEVGSCGGPLFPLMTQTTGPATSVASGPAENMPLQKDLRVSQA
uniref:Uncharacterized protein n=1 Tax=Sphaerodactylus townsendi TaxID=933632 RepID=A0ACB8ER71_9SAUR